LTGERGSADDLVQDALLVAIERPPRHSANLSAWLQRVVRNLHYRRKHRATLLKTTELDPLLEAEEASADEIAEREEILQRAAKLLLELEEPYRSVLVLRYYKDFTPTRIASQLGRPVNTITSQLARGLQQLRTGPDKQHEGDRSIWSRALLPLALPRERRQTNTSKSSSRRLSLSAGALLATGLGAVTLAVFVWRWRSPADRPGGEDPIVAAPATTGPAEVAATPVEREPIAVVPKSIAPPVDCAPPSEGHWLDFEVVDSSGAPIPDARIDAKQGSAPMKDGDLASMSAEGEPTTWIEKSRTNSQGAARIAVRASRIRNSPFVPSRGTRPSPRAWMRPGDSATSGSPRGATRGSSTWRASGSSR
jgi:RNA polymerase sigma-70 factor (ECF subfamily)